MKIFIINAHWYNRGDEAALRAMIDELMITYPNAEIKVHIIGDGEYFPYSGKVALTSGACPAGGRIRWIDFWTRYISGGKLGFRKESLEFYDEIKSSDIVLHGPGGPAIGDIYIANEFEYLARYLLVQRAGKPYAFFAPSMGPFKKKKNDYYRRKILEGASLIAVREPISAEYLNEYGIKNPVYVTMDSAFQHPIDEIKYSKQFDEDERLIDFVSRYNKVVGITITDLMWNPKYKGNEKIRSNIVSTFEEVVNELTNRGYGILFIPQLFGICNDADFMGKFANENCYVLPVMQQNDCYYQQYVIGKMYAVIGMRYHSNIFAAKMGTPFISVSYEQKMSGFMKIAGLDRYCIDINSLSKAKVLETFDALCSNYDTYKQILQFNRAVWQKKAHETTDRVIEILDAQLEKEAIE